MPTPTKNPDQNRKDQLPQREQQQDDRLPQRRDSGIREDQEQIDPPDQADTQRVHRAETDRGDTADADSDADDDER